MNKTMMIGAALSACLLAGCGGGDEPASPEKVPAVDPVVSRMQDKDYTDKLEQQIDKRKVIMREMTAARAALAKAEAEGLTGEALAACSNAVKEAIRKFERNRAESVVLVSQQMKKDGAGALEKLQKKGK